MLYGGRVAQTIRPLFQDHSFDPGNLPAITTTAAAAAAVVSAPCSFGSLHHGEATAPSTAPSPVPAASPIPVSIALAVTTTTVSTTTVSTTACSQDAQVNIHDFCLVGERASVGGSVRSFLPPL